MSIILGFRAGPEFVRYAIVSEDTGNLVLENASTESKLPYPTDATEQAEKVLWAYREIERIFEDTPDISRVVIKTNEYTRTDNGGKRTTCYVEAATMLYCAQKDIQLDVKIYTSLNTTSVSVRTDAENRVGRTNKYWDTKMADAVVAAWWGHQQ